MSFSSIFLELLKECDITVRSLSEAWVSVSEPEENFILGKSDVITQVFVALKSGHLLLGGSWWEKHPDIRFLSSAVPTNGTLD